MKDYLNRPVKIHATECSAIVSYNLFRERLNLLSNPEIFHDPKDVSKLDNAEKFDTIYKNGKIGSVYQLGDLRIFIMSKVHKLSDYEKKHAGNPNSFSPPEKYLVKDLFLMSIKKPGSDPLIISTQENKIQTLLKAENSGNAKNFHDPKNKTRVSFRTNYISHFDGKTYSDDVVIIETVADEYVERNRVDILGKVSTIQHSSFPLRSPIVMGYISCLQVGKITNMGQDWPKRFSTKCSRRVRRAIDQKLALTSRSFRLFHPDKRGMTINSFTTNDIHRGAFVAHDDYSEKEVDDFSLGKPRYFKMPVKKRRMRSLESKFEKQILKITKNQFRELIKIIKIHYKS